MNTTLSINLPNHLAQASQEAAKRMGMSRTEFIRQAIAHELAQFEAHLEEEEMAGAMLAMKKSGKKNAPHTNRTTMLCKRIASSLQIISR